MLQSPGNLFPPPDNRPDEADGVYGVQPQVGLGEILIILISIQLDRPHLPGDEDLSPPSEEAIIPNSMLAHTDILEIVMNIRNESLRKAILMKEDIDFTKAAQILFKETKPSEQIFKIGDKVTLRINLATQLPERIFKIEEVNILRTVISIVTYPYDCRSWKLG